MGTLRKGLCVFYCCQQHQITIKAQSSSDMASGCLYSRGINITHMHHCVMLCYIYVSCLVVFDSVVRTVWYMSEDELHLEA